MPGAIRAQATDQRQHVFRAWVMGLGWKCQLRVGPKHCLGEQRKVDKVRERVGCVLVLCGEISKTYHRFPRYVCELRCGGSSSYLVAVLDRHSISVRAAATDRRGDENRVLHATRRGLDLPPSHGHDAESIRSAKLFGWVALAAAAGHWTHRVRRALE